MLFALGVAKVIRPDQANDAVLGGPYPHVLIEHLEGPSLRRLIRRDGAIPLEQLLPLAAHVAGALQYTANSGFVHLDVKPDNIVMGATLFHAASGEKPSRVDRETTARVTLRRGSSALCRQTRPAAGTRAGAAPQRSGLPGATRARAVPCFLAANRQG